MTERYFYVDWDTRFWRICNELSLWSSCVSRRIGAILVKDKRIISTGYNGPPQGIEPCGKKCPRKEQGYKSGEGLHLCPALHAEENTIINAARMGISTSGSIMYMNCAIPCKDCMKKIINAGIKGLVVTGYEKYDDLSVKLLRESGIQIRKFWEKEWQLKKGNSKCIINSIN